MNAGMDQVKKIYTGLVVLLPLFSVYASGIPGFTLGDIVLFIFFVYWLLQNIKSNKFYISKNTQPLICLCFAIVFLSILSAITQDQTDLYNISIRVIRREFYYSSVILVSFAFFEFKKAKQIVITMGKLGAVYLFIQYMTYYIGHFVLVGYIPFLPVYHENYALLDYDSLYQNMFRPTSFLLEPAHFSRYMCIPLILTLFNKNVRNHFVWAIIMSISIIASTSGTGMVCVLCIWAFFTCYQLKVYITNRKKIRWQYLIAFLSMILVCIFLLNTSIVQTAIERVSSSSLTDVNTAAGARFRGYIQYFNLPFLYQVIGMGYGNSPDTVLVTWFSGASYILYGCGIIGFICCLGLFANIILKNKYLDRKILGIIFFLLFFMDDCFMSHVSVVYLSFIYAKDEIDTYESIR